MSRFVDPPPIAAVSEALAQEATLELLRPLAALAIDHGLKLPALVELMKRALIDAAEAQARSEAEGAVSDSRVSVRTGVHRKDLRRLRDESARAAPVRQRSLAAEVFARWAADPRWLTSRGKPRVLARTHADPDGRSFEALVRSISSDVHPRAVLEELLRLGVAELDDSDRVSLKALSFVPDGDREAMLRLGVANTADHLMAMRGNLSRPSFVEQAVFVDDLSKDSAHAFELACRQAWREAHARLMPELQRLWDDDRRQGRVRDTRVRAGMYSYQAEALADRADQPEPGPDKERS